MSAGRGARAPARATRRRTWSSRTGSSATRSALRRPVRSRARQLVLPAALVATAFLAGFSPAVSDSGCAGRLARSTLAYGAASLLWKDSKSHAVYVVTESDANDPSSATVEG